MVVGVFNELKPSLTLRVSIPGSREQYLPLAATIAYFQGERNPTRIPAYDGGFHPPYE
jgi:hypothetical protein